MLQQTQVSVVTSYFERWMERFPTIEILANAPIEDVLKLWEGLGYYSRARHLHEGARFVMAQHQGVLPSDPQLLAKINGIGPYTQGAIRSFAFRQKAAAVDGNVLRVLSRFYGVEEAIDLPRTRAHITRLAEDFLPDVEPWVMSEALIELGAMVCKKVANCAACPLQKGCLAYRHQRTNELPKRSVRAKTIVLHRQVAVIECEGALLLQKGAQGRVMEGLYEFPYLESMEGDLALIFERSLGIELEYTSVLPSERHAFTHYQVHLYPHLFRAKKRDKRYEWRELIRAKELPFSSGHRRILNKLEI